MYTIHNLTKEELQDLQKIANLLGSEDEECQKLAISILKETFPVDLIKSRQFDTLLGGMQLYVHNLKYYIDFPHKINLNSHLNYIELYNHIMYIVKQGYYLLNNENDFRIE